MKNERHITFEILKRQNYSNLELQRLSHHPAKAFITRLVYTVYQHYELLAFQTAHFLKKSVPSEIELILIMAAAQKYFMDSIADYAIVNESVELTKSVNPNFSGLVNAVLKKMVKQPLLISKNQEESVNLSINHSHPLWMVKLLKAQYGIEVTQKLLEHHNTQPPLDIRYNPFKIDEERLLLNYPVYKEDNYWIAQPDIFQTPALNEGLMVVQDRNSQALINDIEFTNVHNILDACCAPGTKLTQLATRFKEAKIIGVDLHPHRIDLTQSLIEKWGLKDIQLKAQDILEFRTDQKFDLILCDVPCSGLGVMRRKPDLKRRLNPVDLDSLELLQQQILNHCSDMVASQGCLVYATCTLNRKENEKQIERFLLTHPQFKLVKQETLLGYQNNGDSFYMAQLIKD